MKKTFPLRDVLTVTTGRLLTEPRRKGDNGIGNLYELLNWLTGDSLFTHQLGRAGESCKPYLLECFPELKKATEAISLLDRQLATREPSEAISHWLTQLRMIAPDIKDTYEIAPMPDGWTTIDPMIELESMVGKKRIIAVKV